MLDKTTMHISACTACGAENDTVHWRYPHHMSGILVGVLCAACEARVEAAEQARREREGERASKGE